MIYGGLEVCREGKPGKAQYPCARKHQIGFIAVKEHQCTHESLMPESDVVSISEGSRRLVRGIAWLKPHPFMLTEYLHLSEQLVAEIQQIFREKAPG